MAATSWNPLQPHPRPVYGCIPEYVWGALEANSQSFKAGALVYLNSGAVTAVASDGTSVAGIALKDATNVTSGNIEIPILRITSETDVEFGTEDGGTDHAVTNFSPGGKYTIKVDADGVARADVDDGSANVLTFIRPVENADGSTSYRGIFRIDMDVTNLDAGDTDATA